VIRIAQGSAPPTRITSIRRSSVRNSTSRSCQVGIDLYHWHLPMAVTPTTLGRWAPSGGTYRAERGARSYGFGMPEPFLDACAQAQLVRQGAASPAELVDDAISRIEKLNPELNAVIRTRFEEARREAAATGPSLARIRVCHSAPCQGPPSPRRPACRRRPPPRCGPAVVSRIPGTGRRSASWPGWPGRRTTRDTGRPRTS
jgi:hypothetical protein